MAQDSATAQGLSRLMSRVDYTQVSKAAISEFARNASIRAEFGTPTRYASYMCWKAEQDAKSKGAR